MTTKPILHGTFSRDWADEKELDELIDSLEMRDESTDVREKAYRQATAFITPGSRSYSRIRAAPYDATQPPSTQKPPKGGFRRT